MTKRVKVFLQNIKHSDTVGIAILIDGEGVDPDDIEVIKVKPDQSPSFTWDRSAEGVKQ